MAAPIVARWSDWRGATIEHSALAQEVDRIVADSVFVSAGGGDPYAVRYRIACDAAWRVRRVDVEVLGRRRRLVLNADGAGRWQDQASKPVPLLEGAIDVDLTMTPFTHTIPIRRLQLARGQSAELSVAYIRVPELTVGTDPQRYTCLEPGRSYRHDSLDREFAREIETDNHGLVVTYPDYFKRIL